MFGVILAFIASLFEETADSIGKKEVIEKKESIYTMGFLNLFWMAILLFIIALARNSFVFAAASLLTFGIRAALEIAQAHMTVLAITKADRSTFGFLRILTLPLLLIADILLGYTIKTNQIIGIGLIILSFIILFINDGIRKNGAGYVLFTAVNAVATLSLFKYNITHFNSVEAEQGIISIIVMLYMFLMAQYIAKENPLRFFKKPVFFFQSASMGIGSAIMSFAYLFAPASIITAAKRSSGVFSAILSGNLYFHEKNFLIKLLSLIFIISGIIFIIL